MIDTTKPLSYDDGFPKVDNALYRLYPLLEDFSVETTGLYGYLKSWRQNNPDHAMYGKVWLTFAEMEAQSGISYHKLRNYIDVLKKYGLLVEYLSESKANKKIFEILEPLTEAEFRAEYPKAIQRFQLRLALVEQRLIEDRKRRRERRKKA
jgi:hypothetical protein